MAISILGGQGRGEKITTLKVTRKCPLVDVVKVRWKQDKRWEEKKIG